MCLGGDLPIFLSKRESPSFNHFVGAQKKKIEVLLEWMGICAPMLKRKWVWPLGIPSLKYLANKCDAKSMIRAMLEPKEDWSCLLLRNAAIIFVMDKPISFLKC